MPKKNKFRIVHLGEYNKCYLCGYELKNNKYGMKMHFKMSHPNEEFDNVEKDRLRCAVCKKPNCLLH